MTATEIISVRDQGRALVVKLIDDDPREQQEIADAAGIDPSTLSLVKSGQRLVNLGMARRLKRAWPDAAGELDAVAEAITDAGRLPAGYRFPGWFSRLRYPSRPTLTVWPTSLRTDRTPSAPRPAVA